MGDRIQLRRGTTEEWVFANPILQAGEPGYETSTQKIKVGNGVSRWSELLYLEADADSVSWSEVYGKPSAFPPSSHASSHASNGSDALAPSDIGAAPAASPTFTGVITVAATSGSAGSYLPSVTFENDPNTGFGSLSSDTASIFTGGTERFRVWSNGQLSAGSYYRTNVATCFEQTLPAGATPIGLLNNPTAVSSNATVYGFYNRVLPGTATLTIIYYDYITNNPTNSVTTTQGYTVSNAAAVGSQTNKGAQFEIQKVAGKSNWNIYVSGDAPSYFAGNVGIGSANPSAPLDINSNIIRLRSAKTPASASDTGNPGDICWDANYIYVCVATDQWKRSALSTW